MSRWTTLAGMAAVVALVIGITALPATGHDVKPSGSLTFTGKAKRSDQSIVDLRPKGPSVGDRFFLAETLKQGGATAGRLEIDCVNLDARFKGEMCQVTLLLRDGQVAAQSAGLKRSIRGVAPTVTAAGSEYSITGGTRAYQGASGSMLVKSTRSGDTVRVTFAP